MKKELKHIKNVLAVMKELKKCNMLDLEEYFFWIAIIEEEGLKL